MSLRKEKAARLKVHVLENTLKLAGKKSFDDLYVEDLCAKVKISKVTFFKYFPQKEDVLMYYLRIWCLTRAAELKAKPKEGMQAMYYIFDKMSETFEAHPGLLLGLVGYLSDMRRSAKPFPVKPEEKRLLFPNNDEIASVEMLSLDQMFEKFTLEAIFKKEMTKTSLTKDISNLLVTTLYGSILSAHIYRPGSYKQFFRRNLDLLIKGLS
jgi:AcrR family transcriptional regulator